MIRYCTILFVLFTSTVLVAQIDSVITLVIDVNAYDTVVNYRSDKSIRSIQVEPLFKRTKHEFTTYYFNKNEELVKCKSHYFISHRMGSCGELFMREKYTFLNGEEKRYTYRYNKSKYARVYACYFREPPQSKAHYLLENSITLTKLLSQKSNE